VAQLPLFETADTLLVDDATGRITYTPRLLSPAAAQAAFVALRDGVAWESLRRMMYDREVDVPRLVAHFDLAREGPTLPAAVRGAARAVEASTGVPFNNVGLNYYRDGRDSVAPHNDHLHEIVDGFPIALVSLGATRRMTIRAKQPPRRVLHVDLEPGSLLVMSYDTQLNYTHAIPKTHQPVGGRISLAFRVRPERKPSAEGRGIYG
jgi:alkylated DNA repair dioxygenase AlkB